MTEINRRKFVKFSAAGGAAALSVVSGFGIISRAKAAEYTFRIAHTIPANHPVHTSLVAATERIARESSGRVEFKVFPNSQLGSDVDSMSQIRSGALDFNVASSGMISTIRPVVGINSVGFAFKDYDRVWAAMDGKLGNYIKDEIKSGAGLHVLDSMWDYGYRQIASRSKPILKAEDLNGFKIRIPGSETFVILFGGLDASPVAMPFVEVYSALEAGIVDGVENPLTTLLNAKFPEVAKQFSITNHMWDGLWIVANQRIWDGIPADVQELISSCIDDGAVQERAEVASQNEAAIKTLRDAGVTVNEVDTVSFQEKLREKGYYKAWKERYGDEAWALLEEATGPLL